MVELRFLIVELRYLGVDWDCLKISYDFKENLKIDFHQGNFNSFVTYCIEDNISQYITLKMTFP